MMLTESSKTWKKKASSSSSKNTDVPARNLEKYERILEVIDRVGRETVILCKKKVQAQVRQKKSPRESSRLFHISSNIYLSLL